MGPRPAKQRRHVTNPHETPTKARAKNKKEPQIEAGECEPRRKHKPKAEVQTESESTTTRERQHKPKTRTANRGLRVRAGKDRRPQAGSNGAQRRREPRATKVKGRWRDQS
jgi:hypothetical protein